jgi:glycosyltransferase involved in cell wall biosynthesis
MGVASRPVAPSGLTPVVPALPMARYIILNNIITPYRTALFDALVASGFPCEVFYMRETEADRHWKINRSTLRHPHYVDDGFYRMIGRYHLHINPKLIYRMWRAKDAEFIIAGGWNDVDVLILVMLRRLGLLRNRFHFWAEANHMTYGSSRDNWLKRIIRKFVYNAADDAMIIPGKVSEQTFEKWGIHGKHYINLPNTIEEDAFRAGGSAVARRQSERPVFLLPARLVERDKGILSFLQAIGDDNVRRGTFLIAGEGPDKGLIQAFLKDHQLEDHVSLLGFRSASEMADLYRRANVFLLPSFSDPSPLTLIEALIMGLPVLISERCGNHWEAVVPGENGLLFDPYDASSVRRAFEAMLQRSADWDSMGDRSRAIYDRTFRRDLVIRNFVNEMTRFRISRERRAAS